MTEATFTGALGKIGEGLLEGVGCVAVSTLNGVKHLVVAIKGNPLLDEEIDEWELVHRMERGELDNNRLIDEKVSHTVVIVD